MRIYSAEEALADCFEYRGAVGLDTAVEALRLYRERRQPNVDAILLAARSCRVEGVIRPYLEAVL